MILPRVFLTIMLCLPLHAGVDSPPLLWYRQPAANWNEALPLGNGRLGAMVFGGVGKERVQLNEDTLWAGGPYDPSRDEAREALPEAQRLIFANKHKEAAELMAARMLGKPPRQMPYQPVGDLLLEFPGHESPADYQRSLDLDAATARVVYTIGNVRHTREMFVSPVDQVLVVHLSADRPGSVGFTARFASEQNVDINTDDGGTLVMRGRNAGRHGIGGALTFQSRLRVLHTGGTLSRGPAGLTINGADSATLFIAIATSFRKFDDISGDPEALAGGQLEKAEKKSLETLRREHLAAHRSLFRRVGFSLGEAPAPDMPTDERLKKFTGTNDPALAALYFHYARYLLICSSRPGSQPANLQGIWNDRMNPPWDSKYTININIQMNYWIACSTGLAECHEPLLTSITELAESGARTAKRNFGARGWLCNHNFDLWRATAPIDNVRCGYWPVGGAWLCQHLWEHYLYRPDREYLARVYPVLKGAAEFFLDTLVEDPRHPGRLVTCPATSPERPNPTGTGLDAGTTMDMSILRELFANCIQAAEILGVDEDLREQLGAARARLAPLKIGKLGQLQEWSEDWDRKESDNHLSHLYGIFPAAEITPDETPELVGAARVSLGLRGDGDSSWGKAWRACMFARLGDGAKAHELFADILLKRSMPNLFSVNSGIFQIDGNLGGAAAMVEMLMQSHNGVITLLPALPPAWSDGHITGLRARGGIEVEMEWRDGKLSAAALKRVAGDGPVTVRHGGLTASIDIAPGETKRLTDF